MLASPLYALLDTATAEHHGWNPSDLAKAFLDGGATLLQIRAKHRASGAFLDLCRTIVGLARSYGAHVIVNDRVDLAQLARAAGVHLGQDDLDVPAARALMGDDAMIGLSTHTPEQIDAAVIQAISYVAVGPVFGTSTKDTGYTPVGLERVAYAAQRAGPTPVVAIGGITIENAHEVLRAGAASVAVIGDLLVGGDPAGRVEAYLRLLR